ncbi:hypothetical protein BC830DRAFT_1163784 [Chytriomyces sp. MP71]|nr:hypothetical protein BC830DRAFT_1163784 [Chytriomyces sp. MP71]
MKDFLADCLRHWQIGVGFSSETQSELDACPLYADICASAKSVLSFGVPTSATLSLSKSISSKLKSSYLIGIPNQRSVGFLFTSNDLACDAESDNVFEREVAAPGYSLKSAGWSQGAAVVGDAVEAAPVDTLSETDVKAEITSNTNKTLAYGRLFEDARLEALVARTIGTHDAVVVSAISEWTPARPSHVEVQYMHRENGWCADLSFSSTDAVLGTSCLVRLPYSSWSAGAEFLNARTKVSFGAKWDKSHGNGVNSILTFLANPMMGFLNTTYTSSIRKNWVMATSYDFNTYSYNSDLSVGMAYSPPDKSSRLIKWSFSTATGLSLLLEGQFKRAIVGLGVTTNLGLNSSMQRQSIGLEVQFV